MDVASWVVLWSCVAQAAGDRYGPYGGAPGGATMPAGVPTSPPPAGSPYSPPPSQNYPAGAADPIYTAAGQKKTNPATSVTPTGVRPTTTPTPTPSSNAAPNSNAVRTQPPAATPPTTDKSAAGELIREAVVVPQSLSVAGRSASLYEAVAAAGDSQRQLDVVRTYWKAAGELAEYHYDWQQTQFLEHLQKVTAGRGGDSSAAAAEIAARLASARAEVREGELRLVDAQLRLGEVTPQTAAESRALPVDLPHVGIYHTRFEKVYAGRAPSTRAHALSRSLPLRKEVVDLRADGVWAAQDAYEAAFEAYQKGQLPIEEVLTALDDFRTRRNEFINSVRAYNDEIAEYAVLSAPWGSGPEALVRMLIKNPSRLPAVAAVGATVGEDGRVVPASFDDVGPAFEPVPDPVSSMPAGANLPPSMPSYATSPNGSTLSVSPSPAVPRNPPPLTIPPVAIPASAVGAAAAPPPAVFNPPSNAAPLMPYPAGATTVPPISQSPTMAPPTVPSSPPPSFGGGGNPLRGQPTLAPPQVPEFGEPTPQYKVNKIPLGGDDRHPAEPRSAMYDASVVPVGYFAQLASLPPAERAQDLVEALYAAPSGAEPGTRRVTLAECLAEVSPSEQPRVVATYWNAAEQTARADARTKSIARLEALGNAVLRMNDSPAKTASMLRVRSARLAAEADRSAARATLQRHRAELTEAVLNTVDEAWLTPSTSPHGGGYDTKVDALPESLAKSPGIRRMAGRIDVLHDAIVWRSEAVVRGDAACDAILDQFSRGQTTSHTVIADVTRQAAETDALLSATTRYNLTIAGYALAVLPGGAPRETLLGALVVNRTAVASRP